MKKQPTEEYIEKARLLSAEELEKLFARMSRELQTRSVGKKAFPWEVAAIQLEIEADQLREWRRKWAHLPACRELAESGAG